MKLQTFPRAWDWTLLVNKLPEDVSIVQIVCATIYNTVLRSCYVFWNKTYSLSSLAHTLSAIRTKIMVLYIFLSRKQSKGVFEREEIIL
jgi:hypothetical protein